MLRVLALAVVGVLAAPLVWGQTLVADLSDHLIGITTGFTGTEAVLFGAVDGPGDIFVIVTGPPETVTVRRKDRIGGLWLNSRSAEFAQVPSFRAVASSRPDAAALPARLPAGLTPLRLDPVAPVAPGELADYRAALVRAKQREGLYSDKPRPVVFLGNRLFRTNIHFPANVPTGVYSVQVFLVRDGEVASAQTTPLLVSKVGFSADVSEFAHDWPVGYGLVAILGAIAAGWGGASLLRRV